MKHELEITIGPGGEVKIQVRGISGGGCLEAARFLEDALGGLALRELTPDFYRTEATEHLGSLSTPITLKTGDGGEPTGA
jgi:hypothetical protein